PPRLFGQTVVERQGRDIESEIGGPLHVGVAAEDIGPGAGRSDIAGGEEQKAAGADVGGAGCELGLPHRPYERRRLLLGEGLGDMLDLSLRQTRDALDFLRIPFRDLLADLVDAVNALTQEFLVLPAVLENVPQHAVDRGDMGAWTDPDIFGCV